VEVLAGADLWAIEPDGTVVDASAALAGEPPWTG
jgi:hypothetical protein